MSVRTWCRSARRSPGTAITVATPWRASVDATNATRPTRPSPHSASMPGVPASSVSVGTGRARRRAASPPATSPTPPSAGPLTQPAHAVLPRLLVGVGARVVRQQRGVDVDDAERVAVDHATRQDLHVAREHDQVGPVLAEAREQEVLVRGLVGRRAPGERDAVLA